MITTKRITEKEIWVHVNNVNYFNKLAGEQIFDHVSELISEKVNITIDFDGVKSINSNGYYKLFDLMKKADIAQCKIYFSNVNPEIDELIRTLTYTSEG